MRAVSSQAWKKAGFPAFFVSVAGRDQVSAIDLLLRSARRFSR